MKQRLFASVVVCLGLVGMAGCDKPSEASCKKAVANIRELFGTARMSVDVVADSFRGAEQQRAPLLGELELRLHLR